MAKQVQQKTGGAGSVTAATAALEKSAAPGSLLVATISIDKSAGDAPAIGPSKGWKAVEPADSGNSGVTVALAYRVADGTAADQCGWTWEEARTASWWISEYSQAGTLLTPVFALNYVGPAEENRTEVPLGPIVAKGDGFAVAMIGRDTGSGFTFDGGFTEVADFTTESNPGLGVAHILEVVNGAKLSTTPKHGSGDQQGGILIAFGFEVEAKPEPPVVVTGEADEVDHDSATLNGTVDANGELTDYYFEYGTTKGYGTKVPAGGEGEAGEGAAPVAVDEAISGLEPETTYHFRLVALSAGGEDAGEDEEFTTEAEPEEEPGPTISAARVTGEPVDDRLFVGLRHADGSITRWGPDEAEAANIPQGGTFSNSAPGGHRDASSTLIRDPRRDWPDLNLVDDLVLYGRTKPLGRNAFEGQVDHLPSEFGDGMSIGVNAVGNSALLSENESWRALYVALGFDGWDGPSLARREFVAGKGWPQGKISVSTSEDGLVWDLPNEALSKDERASVNYEAPAGLPVARFGYRGTRKGGDWSKLDTPKIYGGDTEVIPEGSESPALTLDDTPRTVAFERARRHLMLEAWVKEVFTPSPGTQQSLSRIALYGETGVPLREIEGELPGVYAHDVLPHMLSTGAPDLKYRVAGDGTIVPNTSFAIPDLAFLDPGTVLDGVLRLNAYFLNNFAVWDERQFHWHPWDPDRVTWRATIAGGAHWAPAGRQARSAINGLVVSYTNHEGKPRLAGPPGSGCDVESPLLQDLDPRNPYTRRGRKNWAVLPVGYPLAYSSTAVQVGHVRLLEHKLPQRSGTLVVLPLGPGHIPQLEHPTIGPVPVWAARSGDYIELDGWPEPEPFRIVEVPSYDTETKTWTAQLDTASSRFSAILERGGSRMKGTA